MAELPADTATYRASEREGLHIDGEWRTPDDHIEATDLTDGERFTRAAAPADVDESEALALADGGDFGLDAAVFTSDYDRAMWLADRIEAGAVRINGAPSHGLGDVPFGGVERSGIGREGIGYTIDAFVREKTIVL